MQWRVGGLPCMSFRTTTINLSSWNACNVLPFDDSTSGSNSAIHYNLSWSATSNVGLYDVDEEPAARCHRQLFVDNNLCSNSTRRVIRITECSLSLRSQMVTVWLFYRTVGTNHCYWGRSSTSQLHREHIHIWQQSTALINNRFAVSTVLPPCSSFCSS